VVKVAVILPKECPLLYELTIFDFIGWTGRRGANTVWRVSAKSLPTLSRVFLCTVTNKWWTHTGGLSLPIQKMLSHNALQIVKFSWIHHFSCQRRRAIKTSYGNTFLLLLFKTLCVPLKVTDVKGQTTIDSFAAKVYLLLSKPVLHTWNSVRVTVLNPLGAILPILELAIWSFLTKTLAFAFLK